MQNCIPHGLVHCKGVVMCVHLFYTYQNVLTNLLQYCLAVLVFVYTYS